MAKYQLHRHGEEDEQRIKDGENIRTKDRTVGRFLHNSTQKRKSICNLHV